MKHGGDDDDTGGHGGGSVDDGLFLYRYLGLSLRFRWGLELGVSSCEE